MMINFEKELKVAHDYFSEAVTEIVYKEDLESNIKDLLEFLHEYNFTVKDVISFYGLSDLQDEFDIIRLMEFLEIKDNPSKYCSIDENSDNPLAINDYGYLIVIDNYEE